MRPRFGVLVVLVLALVACTHDFDPFEPRAAATDSGVKVDGDAPGGCTEPGAKAFGGHCYFVTGTATAWPDAKKACEAAGAHLASITGSDEESALEPLSAAGDRWIGLSRPAASPSAAASFTWVTGEAMSYLKWGAGEPAGAGECGRLKVNGTWGDQPCTTTLSAICERE
jgi:hypothetical protein